MDFDKPKVYGDTSITDGLVLFLYAPGSDEYSQKFWIKTRWFNFIFYFHFSVPSNKSTPYHHHPCHIYHHCHHYHHYHTSEEYKDWHLKRLLTGWLLPLNYQLMQLVKKIFAPREVKEAEMMMMSIGNCDMNFWQKYQHTETEKCSICFLLMVLVIGQSTSTIVLLALPPLKHWVVLCSKLFSVFGTTNLWDQYQNH